MRHRDQRGRLAGAMGLVLGIASIATASKVETWREDSAAAFGKGKRERVVVSDAGKLRLARRIATTRAIDAARVWDLVRTEDGTIYAATGDAGKVLRRDEGGEWALAYKAEDSQALSLVVAPGGKVFVGTGPTGQVVEVSDPKHPASRPDPTVQYIWDLAADSDGNLFAATGPRGQLWKRSAEGTWSLVLDAKPSHLLSVALARDGAVFAGSDGEGLLYRVHRDGKASVVYDASQAEVRALLVAPDGSLYAGTADASGSRGPNRPPGLSRTQQATDRGLEDETPATRSPGPRIIRTAMVQRPTAVAKPSAPGENVVYRIGADGVPREVFRARALVYSLAWQGDRLLVGTGPDGQLFEVRDDGRESSPIARIDHGQVLSLLAIPGGETLLGAGDPGAILRLEAGFDADGTLTSDVHDAKLPSRFGALSWKADRPDKTTVAVAVRTGNVGEPDATWSPWSEPVRDRDGARPDVPPGRFVQYRVTLSTTDPAASPEFEGLTLRYQTANLPPEIHRIDVPDVSEADGATRQTRINLRWDAVDPNGDDLAYTLHLRKEGWPAWIKLGDGPLTEKTYSWDCTAVPAGTYRLRVTASDRPSNLPAEALERHRTSEPFVVDHEAPRVQVEPKAGGKGATVTLRDDLTRLVKAAYALDGGDWVPVFPADGLFDTRAETITVDLPDLAPGHHVLMVRATDAAGNLGTGDAVLNVPSAE
ncbi:MAG TPA: hypothetical protein VG406_00005 [Isosphaeraceae bacterium]|nr:hypothetical protein [Isosphaeraceae bacterium]